MKECISSNLAMGFSDEAKKNRFIFINECYYCYVTILIWKWNCIPGTFPHTLRIHNFNGLSRFLFNIVPSVTALRFIHFFSFIYWIRLIFDLDWRALHNKRCWRIIHLISSSLLSITQLDLPLRRQIEFSTTRLYVLSVCFVHPDCSFGV